ncbi:MAG: hypothetical protein AB1716_16235 [Planctomycetota bacterium]
MPRSRADLPRILLAAALTVALPLCACQQPHRDPGQPPLRPNDAQRPVDQPVAAESPPAGTQRPPTQREPEAGRPAPIEPIIVERIPPAIESPEYVTVLERYDDAVPARVAARVEPGNRLVLDTQNVRRIHIDRPRSGTDIDQSVSLQLDGQGIEWLAHSEVREFARSPNGIWSAVRAAQSGRLRR